MLLAIQLILGNGVPNELEILESIVEVLERDNSLFSEGVVEVLGCRLESSSSKIREGSLRGKVTFQLLGLTQVRSLRDQVLKGQVRERCKSRHSLVLGLVLRVQTH